MSKHFISLDKAVKATKKYRQNKKKLIKEEFHSQHHLPFSETFDRQAFDTLLAQPGCVAVRAYYAMDNEMNVHLVIVGVNEKDEDMLPKGKPSKAVDKKRNLAAPESEAVILDNSTRCPIVCPSNSVLNPAIDDFR